MANVLPLHPLRRWRKARGFSTRDVVALIGARGVTYLKRSIDATETSRRRPSYDICEVIQSITDGEVTIPMLRHWPLREVKPKAKKKTRRAA